MNAREELAAVADWLGWQEEIMSDGIKSMEDAIKLWRYAQKHADTVAEMADEWTPAELRKAIGYNPFKRAAEINW